MPQDPTQDPPPDNGGDPPKNSSGEDYWRKQAEKSQRDLDTLRKSQLSDLDRYKQESEEARRERDAEKSKRESTLIHSRFEVLAARAGFQLPEKAANLADLSNVRVDESGSVIGLEKALDGLKKAVPQMFGGGKPPAPGGGNTPPPSPGGNSGQGSGQTKGRNPMEDLIRNRYNRN